MNEAELLFTSILNCGKFSLCLNRGMLLDKDKCSLIAKALKRRVSAEPIQYILGKTEFMGLEFRVDGNVLIPRPETEILVETVIKYAARCRRHAGYLSLLDLGTGSGNIAVSLAKLIKDCRIIAVDISDKAIEVAKVNALFNEVAEKIDFITRDFFNLKSQASSLKPDSFDVIISNPPYIPTADIDGLQPEIKYEPCIALDGGADGLDFYRGIASIAPFYLSRDGFLIMEMGFNQRENIENIFKKSGDFEIIETVKDYSGIDRVIIIRKKEKNG